MPAGRTFFSSNTFCSGSKAYLLRLPFGVSITTWMISPSFPSKDRSRDGSANPLLELPFLLIKPPFSWTAQRVHEMCNCYRERALTFTEELSSARRVTTPRWHLCALLDCGLACSSSARPSWLNCGVRRHRVAWRNYALAWKAIHATQRCALFFRARLAARERVADGLRRE